MVSPMPWSCAAGTKCVPISPLVVAPQIAKPATSAQKVRVRDASRSASSASRAAFGRATCGTWSDSMRRQSWGSASSAPYAVTPRSAGWSRITTSTRGTTDRAAAAMTSEASRQPACSETTATTGRKTSWPVALPAVRIPVTRPRRRTNQRCATVAANTRAIDPVPRPISTPQVSTSCQLAATKTVSPDPAAISSSAAVVTRRIPKRSMRAAANGAVRPNRTRFTPTASESVPRDQPNSSWSGTIRTPGAARKPAAPSRATNATAATGQAGCTRRRGGASVVMGGALRDGRRAGWCRRR